MEMKVAGALCIILSLHTCAHTLMCVHRHTHTQVLSGGISGHRVGGKDQTELAQHEGGHCLGCQGWTSGGVKSEKVLGVSRKMPRPFCSRQPGRAVWKEPRQLTEEIH